jgi:two-component system sensor kinase FixL
MNRAKRPAATMKLAVGASHPTRQCLHVPIIDLKKSAYLSDDNRTLAASFLQVPDPRSLSDAPALRRSGMFLAEAQQVAHIGSWSRDLRSGELIWSDELYRIFGFRPQEIQMTFESFLSLIQHDDRKRVLKIIQQAKRDRQPYEYFMRVLRRDRSVRDVEVHGNVEFDETARAVRTFGTMQDVTARKESARALRASEERVRLLLDSTAEAIYGVDTRGNCIFSNPACLRLLGYDHPGDLLGRPMHAILHHPRGIETRCPKKACELLRSFRRNREIHTDNVVLWRADGTGIPAEYWCHPVRQEGRVVGAVATFLDITERRRLERAILETSEKERRRIGQDLHDDLCQQLTGIALTGRSLQQRLTAALNSEAAVAIKIVNAVQQANARARDLAKGLHLITLETEGLVSALRELSKELMTVFDISCRFRCLPSHRSTNLPDPAAAIQLYRIAQESSTNAVKHGQATIISICMGAVRGRIRLTIADNGSGIGGVPPTGGMGLPVMHQRARAIGAALTISKRKRGGTLVTCSLPGSTKPALKPRMKLRAASIRNSLPSSILS